MDSGCPINGSSDADGLFPDGWPPDDTSSESDEPHATSTDDRNSPMMADEGPQIPQNNDNTSNQNTAALVSSRLLFWLLNIAFGGLWITGRLIATDVCVYVIVMSLFALPDELRDDLRPEQQDGWIELDNFIESLLKAVSLPPGIHRNNPKVNYHLGHAYLKRFVRLGSLPDISSAIERLTCAISLIPNGYAHHAKMLHYLGTAYDIRFQHLRDPSDIEKAVEYLAEAVALTPEAHPSMHKILHDLGKAYHARFLLVGDSLEISKAIGSLSKALALTPRGHIEMVGILSDLSSACRTRFWCLDDLSDANNAVEYLTQALTLTSNGAKLRPIVLNNLGFAYLARFKRLGGRSDIDNAIECQSKGLSLSSGDLPNLPLVLRLYNLGEAHHQRFEHWGNSLDFNCAKKYLSEALVIAPDENKHRPIVLKALGDIYADRFGHSGEQPDASKAIGYYRSAILLTPEGDVALASLRRNLGRIYSKLVFKFGDIVDYDNAMGHPSKVQPLAQIGCEPRPEIHGQLKEVCLNDLNRTSDISALDHSVKYWLSVVSQTPDDHVDLPLNLDSLGVAYYKRYNYLSEPLDLYSTITCHTKAVVLTPNGHSAMPARLSNLGRAYLAYFPRSEQCSHLDLAIKYQNMAVSLTPTGHISLPTGFSRLGNAYLARFKLLENPSDINNAIESHCNAVRLTPDGNPYKPSMLNDLGSVYQERFKFQGDASDINNAIECGIQGAALLTHRNDICKPAVLYGLGMAYVHRFGHYSDNKDLFAALRSFEESAYSNTGYESAKFLASVELARLSKAHGQFDAQAGYQKAIDLIPREVWVGGTAHQRYERIVYLGDLATEAASYALSVKSYDVALEWLEEGRSIMWNQTLQLRSPLDELSKLHPDLSTKMRQVSQALERASSQTSDGYMTTSMGTEFEGNTQIRHRLATEWNSLLQEARSLPGFDNLIRPREFDELRNAASDGPVVVINLWELQCDALVLLPRANEVAHVPLPFFSVDKATEVRQQLSPLTGYRGFTKASQYRPRRPEDDWRSPLRELWSGIVKPVLEHLGCTDPLPLEQLPHVTWCTTGPLSFLPLHAAGCYDGLQPNTSDLIVSSYTPTLGALLASASKNLSSQSGILAVGQEQTPGQSHLPYTKHELVEIKKHHKIAHIVQLDNQSATVGAVLEAMEEQSWVHFACHATQVAENPAQSAFHLHDGDLTLSEIMKKSFTNKGLAFLSACQTATGDSRMPDEAFHLTAGMLMAGYSSVIGTMWSIHDEDGPEISGGVYAELLKDGKMDCMGAARALHKSVAALRDKVGENAVGRWAPFIHVGS